MARVCGACCGLLVFSAMTVFGMLTGNAAPSILARALCGLFGGFVLGSLAGWIGMYIVRENVNVEGGDVGTSPAPDGVPAVSSPSGRTSEPPLRQG